MIGGSWPGSPSTNTGVPNDNRSRPHLRTDHRHLVDHDEVGVGDLALPVESPANETLAPMLAAIPAAHGRTGLDNGARRSGGACHFPSWYVDERIDGHRVGASFALHDVR